MNEAVKSLLDIDAVVDAYCEADYVRGVADRLMQKAGAGRWKNEGGIQQWISSTPVDSKTMWICGLLTQWADAREASVATMLER